jgi:hypothetical protein
MASLEADQWVVDSELGNSPFESFAAFSIAANRRRHPRSKVAAPVEEGEGEGKGLWDI